MANGIGLGEGWTLTPKMVMGWTLTIQVIVNTVWFFGFQTMSEDRYTGMDGQHDRELFEEKLRGVDFRFIRNEAHIKKCLQHETDVQHGK